MPTLILPKLNHNLKVNPSIGNIPSGSFGVDRSTDTGSLSGKIMKDGTPTTGRLDLYLTDSKFYIDSVQSELDGSYRFDNLDCNKLYDVVATLDGEEWEKKVSSRRRPNYYEPVIDNVSDGASGESVDLKLWTAKIVSDLKFVGANGSTTFTDETGGTWTATNATIATDYFKWGNSSGRINGGTGTTASIIEKGSALDLTKDFTFQAWIRPNTVQSTAVGLFFLGDTGSNANRVQAAMSTTNIHLFRCDANGSGLGGLANYSAVAGQWIFLEMSYEGRMARIFVNGVKILEFEDAAESLNCVLSGTATLKFGVWRSNDTLRYFDGHIGEARFIEGNVLHRQSYTPPTAPLNIL